MHFMKALHAAWQNQNSLLCVGLDPEPARFPAELKGRADRIFDFCAAIVDATADLVCAFKPQIAYFAAHRAEDQLEALIAYIHKTYPTIPVILDAKRGDIGSTAEQYAIEAFERYQADAVTLNPYMGSDTLAPFLAWRDKGVILLCRTSNPGGDDIQMLDVGGEKLFEHIARKTALDWNSQGNCGLVVGATYPQELARVRKIVGPNMPLLVPGVGTQGGNPRDVCEAAATPEGGLIVNVSRAILYASNSEIYQTAAREEALTLQHRLHTSPSFHPNPNKTQKL